MMSRTIAGIKIPDSKRPLPLILMTLARRVSRAQVFWDD
jgi:hypothetical protein